jgi:hypothetical protein
LKSVSSPPVALFVIGRACSTCESGYERKAPSVLGALGRTEAAPREVRASGRRSLAAMPKDGRAGVINQVGRRTPRKRGTGQRRECSRNEGQYHYLLGILDVRKTRQNRDKASQCVSCVIYCAHGSPRGACEAQRQAQHTYYCTCEWPSNRPLASLILCLGMYSWHDF